jgi:hypothetical protein
VTVSQKAALSLLISVFLFAGVAVLAYTGLFNLVETRFYNPSIAKALVRETGRNAEVIQDFFSGLDGRFSASLNEPAIKRSFLPNQSAEDIFERSRIYGALLESIGGFQSVRFVDYNGIRIHFSTYTGDVISQTRLSIAYRNYNEDPMNLPFDEVQVPAQGSVKLTMDGKNDRIIFSYPFYDSFDVYRGSAFFIVSARALADWLIRNGRIKVGEDISIVAVPPGIVSGSPETSKAEILDNVSSIWRDGLLTLTPFVSPSNVSLALLSVRLSQGIHYGHLVDESLFSFPQAMKVILLVSIFLTIYLIVFLFFNLRQDTMTIVQSRLKGLQISLIEQFYDRKGDMDWTHWTRELEQRREDIRAEVKRGIRSGQGRRIEEDIDTLIDKSWNELLAVIGAQRKPESGIDEEKLQNILNRILQAAPSLSVQAVQPHSAETVPAARTTAAENADPETVETLDEAEDAEPVEELEEAEAVEEIEDAEPVEEAEAVEDAEPVEEAEAVEEIEDAEPVEEAEAVEEIEDAEPVEEAELVEDAEAVEDAEPVEDMQKVPGAAAPSESAKKGGLFKAASGKKASVRLAFGEDDVPYIVESSGLELVDDDINSSIEDMQNDNGYNAASADESEDIEELEELEEPEELEELEELEEPEEITSEDSDEAGTAISSGSREKDLAELASKIEFSNIIQAADETEEELDAELEIVSPFASILSNLGEKEKPSDAQSNDDFSTLVQSENPAVDSGAESPGDFEILPPEDEQSRENSEYEKKKSAE